MTPDDTPPTAASSEGSSSRRDDLAALIDAGERELQRMRAAASEAAREEKRRRDERMEELRHDFEHNLTVLAQRERTIEELGDELVRMEESHAAEMREAEERATLRLSDAESEIRSELEGEYQERGRRLREEMDRDFLRRLNLGVREREKDIQDEVLESVSVEMERRDRTIASLERMLEKVEDDCLKREEAMRDRLRVAEEAHAEKLRRAEASWKLDEKRLKEQLLALQRVKEGEVGRFRDVVAELERSSREKDQRIAELTNHVACQEADISCCRDSIMEKDGKISDLLQTILRIEESVAQKQDEWKQREEEMFADIQLKRNEMEALGEEAAAIITKYEDDGKKISTEHASRYEEWGEREKELSALVRRLEGELDDMRKCKEENEAAARKKIGTGDARISKLELQLSRLHSENSSQGVEIRHLKQCAEKMKQTLTQIHSEHDEALRQREKVHLSSENQLRNRYEEIQKLHEASNDELRQVALERDKAIKEQGTAMTRVNELEQEMSRLRSRFSDLQSALPHKEYKTEAKLSPPPSPQRSRKPSCGHMRMDWPQDSSCDNIMDGTTSAFSMLSDDRTNCGYIQNSQSPFSTQTLENGTDLGSLRVENTRLKTMIAVMRKELEAVASAEQTQEIKRNECSVKSSGEGKRFEQSCEGDCQVCLAFGALEKQLCQCRKYLDFLLDNGGSASVGKCRNGEVDMLRETFRELNHLVDELRHENKRLSSESPCQRKQDDMDVDCEGATGEQVSAREFELEEKVAELSSELDVLLSDRNRLLDLSNKLRARLLQKDRSSREVDGNNTVHSASGMEDTTVPCAKNLPEYQIRYQDEASQGLAISSQSVGLQSGKCHIAAKATDRATASQRQYLARLQRGHQTNKTSSGKKSERTKVRNWNLIDDND